MAVRIVDVRTNVTEGRVRACDVRGFRVEIEIADPSVSDLFFVGIYVESGEVEVGRPSPECSPGRVAWVVTLGPGKYWHVAYIRRADVEKYGNRWAVDFCVHPLSGGRHRYRIYAGYSTFDWLGRERFIDTDRRYVEFDVEGPAPDSARIVSVSGPEKTWWMGLECHRVSATARIESSSDQRDFELRIEYAAGPADEVTGECREAGLQFKCGKGQPCCRVPAPSRSAGTEWGATATLCFPKEGHYVLLARVGVVEGGQFRALDEREIHVDVTLTCPEGTSRMGSADCAKLGGQCVRVLDGDCCCKLPPPERKCPEGTVEMPSREECTARGGTVVAVVDSRVCCKLPPPAGDRAAVVDLSASPLEVTEGGSVTVSARARVESSSGRLPFSLRVVYASGPVTAGEVETSRGRLRLGGYVEEPAPSRAAGTEWGLALSVTLPAAGDYVFEAQAGYTDERGFNVTSSRTVTVRARARERGVPRFSLRVDRDRVETEPGGAVRVVYTVANVGNERGSVRISAALDGREVHSEVLELGPGKDAMGFISATAPERPGAYTLRIVAHNVATGRDDDEKTVAVVVRGAGEETCPPGTVPMGTAACEMRGGTCERYLPGGRCCCRLPEREGERRREVERPPPVYPSPLPSPSPLPWWQQWWQRVPVWAWAAAGGLVIGIMIAAAARPRRPEIVLVR